ncbi:SDR family oxidoreductase [Flavobacterium salilacus subsp. salilacus]|uniref:enoyl-ACP reductase FabI n=1 Tax=Flavobacterium TaxID=237 RepID=UPI001074DD26|nr:MULTISPECIES: SDR family oxidoreductase [Flavobacterium]KAF2517506.1 SDR family oxidoreductase [Flavobacterium salilacus subsp. salilacus]MBE1615654.1 SDR family oxidoreductase [Flavobacterium sp. SaA2.13]NDI99726.1 SDR family oxidoreductase [Flavobacterium salilacus subsp. altitudinum]
MHNLLKGKRGIITGALDQNSIAWKVAEKAHEQGATFVLTNAPIAMRMGEIKVLAEKTGSEIIPADATNVEELTNLYTQAQEILGGKIDFILHSIGMSVNIRKNIPYTESNYDYFMKGIDVSALSLHKMLSVAKKMDALNEGGSVVALTYMAAQRTYPFYTDMADIKAMLESIARSFGYHYGVEKKVRINTVSQSPTKTTAGTGIKGFGDFYDFADSIAPLGNADAESCADYCITLFSDLTRMVTMQNLFHDGGYSSTGVSTEVMERLSQQ